MFIPFLNSRINYYVEKFGLYIDFRLDKNFNEKILVDYVDEAVYNGFSEGEKQRIDLSITFAFLDVARSRNYASFNLLFLDDAAEERERQIQRKRIMYGSRTERDDRPDDDEQTDAINIFVDSEFIVVGADETHILAIPESKKKKAESSKQMMEYYTVRLEPKQIFEIFFVPKSSNYVFEPKKVIDYSTIQIDGVDSNDYPDFADAYISYAEYTDGTPLDDEELEQLNNDMPEYAQEHAVDSLT
jgi:hypothetical protein